MKSLLILVLCLFSFKTNSAELTSQSYIDGFKTGWTYFYQGAYMQFTERNNLYYGAAAVPSLWYSFHEDKRISANAQTKPIRGYQRIASDISPFMSFPIIPIAFYTYGVKKDNTKAMQFATETFATLYLALIESAVLSAIPIHERPNNNGLSAWETRFREKSSFPSGHVVPYAAFALKAFQFYGPVAAIVPSFLFVGASIQRVRDGKHYLSDVVGGFFITAFASEGVRKAGGWTDNHPVYKAIFERNMQVGYIEYNGAIGPRITFDW